MILDHPVLLKEHITAGPKDYYLLVHDRNYLNFVKQYYRNIKDRFLFSPAGIISATDTTGKQDITITEKIYDVSFIGSYYNYRQILANLKSYDRNLRFLANHFLTELRRNPDLPTETALKNVLNQQQICVSDEQFLDLLFQFRYVFFCVMYFYREKVIRTLLDAGIEINVYGDSWNSAPFADHPCLIRHPQVDAYESLFVMQQSRISLNIMAWHKDGFTERIANAMLNRSVVVSDRSTQLEKLFVDGQDLVLFDLKNITSLPTLIHSLLKSTEQLNSITLSSYLTAYKKHRWTNRAEKFLKILDSIR